MYAAVERTSLAQYRSLFELNVVGVLAAMQAVIPLMRRTGGGLIINISSGTTKMILPGTGPYASTKHALNGLSMVARAELEPEHIGVSLVYPWITATGFQANALSVNTVTSERIQAARGDSAEYVAELIAQAVQSEAAEVYADNVLLGMARQSRG
jgi:short-subunit dehydrogenase